MYQRVMTDIRPGVIHVQDSHIDVAGIRFGHGDAFFQAEVLEKVPVPRVVDSFEHGRSSGAYFQYPALSSRALARIGIGRQKRAAADPTVLALPAGGPSAPRPRRVSARAP